MMAKKAAEKARKDMEEELSRQAEEKRLQSLPPWKRQLMQNKRQDDKYVFEKLLSLLLSYTFRQRPIISHRDNWLV